MFTIAARLTPNGPIRSVTWDDGELRGDEVAIMAITVVAEAREGSTVGHPEGPFTTHNHMADPLSAATIISEAMIPPLAFSGYLPRPERPPGSV